MDLILCKNLYLGDVHSAQNENYLLVNSVTHVLTVDSFPIPVSQQSKRIAYKFVEAEDTDQSDLLKHFDECFDFINPIINRNDVVLVHCHYGISRSTTIVAAYLMRRFTIPAEEALKMIQASRPCASPNSGFMKQLNLYERMGFNVTVNNPVYRYYRLSKLARRLEGNKFEITQMLFDTSSEHHAPEQLAVNDVRYKCRKCRSLLFSNSCFVYHNVGQQNSCTVDAGDIVDRCLCYYITPVKWMQSLIYSNEGKIYCYACRSKLGSYCWSGMKCVCGVWVTPGFHIQASKIDVC